MRRIHSTSIAISIFCVCSHSQLSSLSSATASIEISMVAQSYSKMTELMIERRRSKGKKDDGGDRICPQLTPWSWYAEKMKHQWYVVWTPYVGKNDFILSGIATPDSLIRWRKIRQSPTRFGGVSYQLSIRTFSGESTKMFNRTVSQPVAAWIYVVSLIVWPWPSSTFLQLMSPESNPIVFQALNIIYRVMYV
jgi:hypothetical protein